MGIGKTMIASRRSGGSPIGLHLEARSVTLVQLTSDGSTAEVQARASSEIPCDEQASSEERDRQTVSVLRSLLHEHGFKGRRVVSCLGAQQLFVQNVRLPQLPPAEIEKVVRWEAEERLPYPVDDAEIRHLIAGQVRQDANIKQEVILLACHQGVVQRHVSVLEQAGLRPICLDAEPCAVLRALGPSHEPAGQQRRRAYLNLGQKATSVLFAEDDQILFLKYIASGGHHLDQAVARYLELDLPEAARMRATVTTASEPEADEEIHRSVLDAIRQPLESIASEIELCLRYYKVTFRGKPLDKVIGTGSEASPWLLDYLSRRLGTPCELGNPFEALGLDSSSSTRVDRPGRWTTAIGLSRKDNLQRTA